MEVVVVEFSEVHRRFSEVGWFNDDDKVVEGVFVFMLSMKGCCCERENCEYDLY